MTVSVPLASISNSFADQAPPVVSVPVLLISRAIPLLAVSVAVRLPVLVIVRPVAPDAVSVLRLVSSGSAPVATAPDVAVRLAAVAVMFVPAPLPSNIVSAA